MEDVFHSRCQIIPQSEDETPHFLVVLGSSGAQSRACFNLSSLAALCDVGGALSSLWHYFRMKSRSCSQTVFVIIRKVQFQGGMGSDEVVESCVLHLYKMLQKGGEALILQQRGGRRSPQVTMTTLSDGEFPGRVFIDRSMSWLRDSSRSGDSEGGMRGLEALCMSLVMDLQGNPAACLEGRCSDPRILRDSSSTQSIRQSQEL